MSLYLSVSVEVSSRAAAAGSGSTFSAAPSIQPHSPQHERPARPTEGTGPKVAYVAQFGQWRSCAFTGAVGASIS